MAVLASFRCRAALAGVACVLSVSGCYSTPDAAPGGATPSSAASTSHQSPPSSGQPPTGSWAFPARDDGELARIEYVASGPRVDQRTGVPAPAGESFVLEGRCLADGEARELDYQVVPATGPASVVASGKIACDDRVGTSRAVLPGSSDARLQIEFDDTFEGVRQAYVRAVKDR